MFKTIDQVLTYITAGGISAMAYIVGGLDNLVTAFMIFIVCDYLSGMLASFVTKRISSQRGWIGVAKKAGMLLFVVIAVQLDKITGDGSGEMFRNTILMFLIGVEGISILENLGALGIPVPQFIIRALERFKNDNEE